MTDLSRYAALSRQIAALDEDDELSIAATDLADPLADVQELREVIIDTSYRRFMGSAGPGGDRPFEIMDQSPGFISYVTPETLRRVGGWLLHLLFSGRDWAGLRLTHPTSRAQWLYVQLSRPEPGRWPLRSEVETRYIAYSHAPQIVHRHPFADPDMAGADRIRPEDRPLFAFGWSTPDYNGAMSPATADQIIVDLTPDGLCALASLFFDIGHKTFGLNEVDMEPPHVGFAATQPRSIEARFWMPGSLGFYADTLDQITLPPARPGG